MFHPSCIEILLVQVVLWPNFLILKFNGTTNKLFFELRKGIFDLIDAIRRKIVKLYHTYFILRKKMVCPGGISVKILRKSKSKRYNYLSEEQGRANQKDQLLNRN
jgi:hypothetical protein